MLSFKTLGCDKFKLLEVLYGVGVDGEYGNVSFWDELDYTVVQGYLNDTLVCYAVLSYDEAGVQEPYDGDRLIGFKHYLHWFQTQKEFRGKGYGREMFSYLEAHFECPIVFESFCETTAFYLKCGAFLLSDLDCIEDKLRG